MTHTQLLTRFVRRLDSGLLITLALCLFTLWPLVSRPGLPNGDDVLYHVYRAAEMDRAWSHGVIFPQWAEAFYTGYGAPLFHYYASLTYYLTSLITRLFGFDAVNSLRLLIAVCMLGSGGGMYAFARRYSGKTGGIIAALCYVYSPYILFTEPYSRGVYPELLAFTLFPLLMWAYSRLLPASNPRPTASAFLLAVLLEGLLIITHNLMALVLSGVLVGWLAWNFLWDLVRTRTLPRAYGWVFLAVGLGVMLAAYFWLPVAQEGFAVKLSNLTGTAELNYRNFFVPTLHLFEANPRVDAGAFNGLEHRLNLGLPQWTLGLLSFVGFLILLLTSRRKRTTAPVSENSELGTRNSVLSPLSTILFFALSALVLIFLILSASAPLWQAVAPLAFLQFPWRLLGPAVFCLSLLAGLNTLWLERLPARVGGLLAAGIIVFIIALASPTLYITEWIHPTVDTSVSAYQQAEVQGLQRATTFSNEYLPATVSVEPGPTPRLLEDYADGYPVNKAHLEVFPPGVTVDLLDHGPQHDQWKVNTPEAFTFEVLTYAFPGWRALVDGQPVEITPSDPHGLITFAVPAGEHTVRVELGSTPPRDLGNALTVLAALVAVGVVVFLLRSARTRPVSDVTQPAAFSPRYVLLGGLISLVFLVVYLREGGAWVNSPVGEARLAQHTTAFQLGESLHLIGYDLNGDRFRPGDRLELTAYWYTTASIPYGYASFVHVSTGGPPLAQADKLNPANLPTKTWTSTGFLHDDYVIELPPDMPPGEYQIYIGLYTCDTLPAGECGNGDRLPVSDAAGNPVGDEVPLAKIQIVN